MKKTQYASWRFAIYLLTAALVLVSAGCSGRTISGATPTLASPGAGSEEAIITFASWEYQRQFYESLMATFHEQNPDITVQFVDIAQFYPTDVDWTQFNYLRSLAQAADTVMLSGPFDIDMSRYFRNLQPLYESDPSFQPDDFWPGILTSCEDTYGNMVGLPMNASVNGIFYDEATFDTAGVPYPKPGWTWDDFQKTVIALADKSGSQVKYGFYDSLDLGVSILAPVIIDHLLSHGGEVDATGLLNEVQWYIDLAQAEMLSGVKPNEEDENYWDERWGLLEDEARRPAMWVESLTSSAPSSEIETYDPGGNPFFGMAIDRFGFAPFPVSSDGASTQTSRSWVECAAVSAGSTNPRAAWAWLNFLSRQWLVMDRTIGYEIGRAPARQSVAESNGYWDLLPTKASPAVRYALEHGSYNFAYIDRFGEIHVALAKSIYENADFVQVLETAIAERPPAIPTPTVDNAPIVVATPLAPLPEGVTVIKYYNVSYSPSEFDAMKALVEQYNQRSPDTQVRLFADFQGRPDENWTSSMANNFDCFTANAPYWREFDATLVLDLNSLLSNEPASFSSDFLPEMMDKFRQEGKLYALPASSQMQMMVYNADLLARRGLPIPANDWTFDDFIEMATLVASTSDADPSYGYLYSPYDVFITLGKGVKWVDYESNPPQVYLDSREMLEHLKWISDLQQGRVLFNQDNNWEKFDTIMSSGQLAFWIAMMGEKYMWAYNSGQENTYKIGMAPLPRISGDNPMISWSIDRGHYISAQAQDARACWDWIKFLSEQPDLFSGVPARRSLVESPAWEAFIGVEDAAAYRAAIENLEPTEMIDIEMQQVLWPLSEWRNQAIRAALDGQDLQPFLIALQQKAETFLACALSLDTSKPYGEINEGILNCLKQADPEWGGY